jgi:hypothetical protein
LRETAAERFAPESAKPIDGGWTSFGAAVHPPCHDLVHKVLNRTSGGVQFQHRAAFIGIEQFGNHPAKAFPFDVCGHFFRCVTTVPEPVGHHVRVTAEHDHGIQAKQVAEVTVHHEVRRPCLSVGAKGSDVHRACPVHLNGPEESVQVSKVVHAAHLNVLRKV